MRKIYLLLVLVISFCAVKAQSTAISVNFVFSVNPTTNNVIFTNTSANLGNDVKKAFWTFGDGSSTQITGGLDGTTHHYVTSGTYQACLKIYKYISSIDSILLGSECKPVTIQQTCTADYQFHDSLVLNPFVHHVSFYGTPGSNSTRPITHICWNFGDGTDTCINATAGISITPFLNIKHEYHQNGSYNVCLKITYDGGCVGEKCNSIVLTSPPPAVDPCTFTLNETATNVSNLERKFYVGLQPNRVAERICWSFGDGSDTCVILSNPVNAQQLMITHHYASPGTYNVCAKVTYVGSCTVQHCHLVSIAVTHSNICGGYLTDSIISTNTIHFTGTGIQNTNDYVVSYNWTFGDAASGSGQTVNHTYGGPGHYNVCLYLKTNTGCETRICKQVEVSGTNQPQLILSPNPVVSTLTALFHSLFQQTVSVKIYNANGLMVRSYVRNASMGSNIWTFDAGSLPTGVYSVIVQSSNQFATAIFFKQ